MITMMILHLNNKNFKRVYTENSIRKLLQSVKDLLILNKRINTLPYLGMACNGKEQYQNMEIKWTYHDNKYDYRLWHTKSTLVYETLFINEQKIVERSKRTLEIPSETIKNKLDNSTSCLTLKEINMLPNIKPIKEWLSTLDPLACELPIDFIYQTQMNHWGIDDDCDDVKSN